MTNKRIVTPASLVDSRVDNESFLLCLALTYLGLPPGVWRIVVNELLEAASEEYRHRYGPQRGTNEFEQWRKRFQLWSAFNKFKIIIVFLGESKIGMITISNATAKVIRMRLLAQLVKWGLKEAAIIGASQIIRKVTVLLEIAWLTGCATYCGSVAAKNAIVNFTVSTAEAISKFVKGVRIVGQAINTIITQIVALPILIAQAKLDPSNWDTTPMPVAVLELIGNSLWSKLQTNNADKFLSMLSRPMSEFSFPKGAIDELTTIMTKTVNARGGMQSGVMFTPEVILGSTPLKFVQFLQDWRLLDFKRDPEQIANQALKH